MSLSSIRSKLKRKAAPEGPSGIYTRTAEEREDDFIFIARRVVEKMPTHKIREELHAVRDYELSIQTVRADRRAVEKYFLEYSLRQHG
jgi:hypothetical protein